MSRPILTILLGFIALTIARVMHFYLASPAITPGQHLDFQAILREDPKVRFGRQSFRIRVGDMWSSRELYISTADPMYEYGELLHISGTVQKKKLYGTTQVLALINPTIDAKPGFILPIFAAARQRIDAFFVRALPQPYAGLISGVLLGIKSSVTPETSYVLKQTGLSHILVVDGMKVALVSAYLMSFFTSIFRRKTALVLAICSIGIYIMLSGLEISALRSGFMAVLAFSAQGWGRQYSGLFSLFFVTLTLLLWDPLLLESVGFQLSVTATAGIILIRPLIPLKGILKDELSITMAASLATLPIVFGTFGGFSLSTFPVHVLVMWTLPFIIIFGGMGAVASFICFPFGQLVVYLATPFLWFLTQVATFFAQFDWQISMEKFSPLLTVGWYLLLVSVILILRSKFHPRPMNT